MQPTMKQDLPGFALPPVAARLGALLALEMQL